jgi:membrane associated rhomboid family serine protease
VWLRIHSAGLGYQDVGCSYDLVVRQLQFWRLLTAQISHVSGLHLLFNCSALWNMGSVETGGLRAAGSGSVFYLSYTLLFFVLSAVGITGLYALAVKAFRREQDASTLTVGYSCVVFAWMAFLAASAGATSTYSLFGAVSIPANLMPFGALIFTSIIVPQASFLGHLAGLVSGYIVAFVPHIPLLANIGTFACFMCGIAWSLYVQFGSQYLRLPNRSSEDVELG